MNQTTNVPNFRVGAPTFRNFGSDKIRTNTLTVVKGFTGPGSYVVGPTGPTGPAGGGGGGGNIINPVINSIATVYDSTTLQGNNGILISTGALNAGGNNSSYPSLISNGTILSNEGCARKYYSFQATGTTSVSGQPLQVILTFGQESFYVKATFLLINGDKISAINFNGVGGTFNGTLSSQDIYVQLADICSSPNATVVWNPNGGLVNKTQIMIPSNISVGATVYQVQVNVEVIYGKLTKIELGNTNIPQSRDYFY